MKARRAIAVAAATTIATTVGVIGAATASAATARAFCVNGTSACAIAEGGNAVFMPRYSTHPSAWLFNGAYHDGQIQQDGTGLCMQLDKNGGYIVIEAACNGANYQKWDPYYLNGSIVYASEYDESQCLTYNRDLARLDTVACTGAWYQNFPYPN